jgi:hypothetical protein
MESSYTIDANDRLIAIDGPWDTFALENGGELVDLLAGYRESMQEG